jgi:SAM-dependent methyltransferase
MYVFEYILLISLVFVFIFFLFRTIIVAITMLTEVPFLPSSKLFERATEYLDIKNGNKVLDIGSGDGRVLIYASKKYPEASFVGIERNLFLVMYSNVLKTILLRKNLKFKLGNIYDFDVSEFDRIYMYLIPEFIDKILIKKEGEIKKGCKILSFDFSMGYEFPQYNNISKYTVEYKGKEKNIFKWEKK